MKLINLRWNVYITPFIGIATNVFFKIIIKPIFYCGSYTKLGWGLLGGPKHRRVPAGGGGRANPNQLDAKRGATSPYAADASVGSPIRVDIT